MFTYIHILSLIGAKIKAFIVSLSEHAAKQYLFQEFEKMIVQKTLARSKTRNNLLCAGCSLHLEQNHSSLVLLVS